MPVRGPRLKILRRFGTPLPGLTRKTAERRPQPPGVHGAKSVRRRTTPYRRLLEEKQKVRFNYGVTERQLRRYLERARTGTGTTGENLLVLLERRLDNVVFRLGLAPTIPAARQLVVHGHVRVDTRRVDRPGFAVSVGDVVDLAARARKRADADRLRAERLPRYLARDPADPCAARVIALPTRADVPLVVEETMIVELYAR